MALGWGNKGLSFGRWALVISVAPSDVYLSHPHVSSITALWFCLGILQFWEALTLGNSYRDLRTWKQSMELNLEIYRVTASFPKHELYGLVSQLRRASVSIASNIAEGKGRIIRSRVHFVPASCAGISPGTGNTTLNCWPTGIHPGSRRQKASGSGRTTRERPKCTYQLSQNATSSKNATSSLSIGFWGRPTTSDERPMSGFELGGFRKSQITFRQSFCQ